MAGGIRGTIDPWEVLASLGVVDATSVSPVTGGWDAALWRVERRSSPAALRVFRPEQALSARHEELVMRLARFTAPVPDVLAAGAWHDRPALLLEWCRGRTVASELQARPWRAMAIGRAFGRAQAYIHAAPIGYELNDLAGRWLMAVGPGEDALRRRLRALAGPNCLLHLDFHPLNVMIDGDQISGILDWTNALPGDRRADLARTFSILRLTADGPGRPRVRNRVVLRLFERGWRIGYRREAGRVRDLPVFYAWAGALMQRDLAPRVGRPDAGLTDQHMAEIRAWTDRWKRRAGVGA